MEITESMLLIQKQKAVKIRDLVIQAKATKVEIDKNLDTLIESFTQFDTTKDTYNERVGELTVQIETDFEKCKVIIQDCEKVLRENGML